MSAAISACAAASPPRPNIEYMVANARTASDHEAIAEYYEQEAADAKIKYEEHRAAALRYERDPRSLTVSWHCNRLAQDFKDAAQDASVLAAQHRKIAEELNVGHERPLLPPVSPVPIR